jgi:hypothetical protein
MSSRNFPGGKNWRNSAAHDSEWINIFKIQILDFLISGVGFQKIFASDVFCYQTNEANQQDK